MADFMTSVFAGASGGLLRAFKASAILDAEERKAKQREEGQIKLLMKQSEQKEVAAQRKRVADEAFDKLQQQELFKHQLDLQKGKQQGAIDIAKLGIQGRQKVAELGISGRQEVAETGVAGRKEVAEIRVAGRADVAAKELAAKETQEPSLEAAQAYGQATLAMANGDFARAQELTLQGDETANAKQRETHNKNLLRAQEINNRAPADKAKLVQEGIETYLSLDINDTTDAIFKERARKKAGKPSLDKVKRFIQDSLSAGYDISDIRKYIEEQGWDVSIDILED